MPLSDKLRTRKHAIMESVIDQLENIAQIEHTHSASESHQFYGQSRLRVDCLLPSTEETSPAVRVGFAPRCLTRTDVS